MANTYLSRTGISGANQKKWTFSGWFKKSSNGSELRLITSSDNSSYDDTIKFKSADKIEVVFNNAIALTTNRLFRDNNAYYHIVVKVDTDQASANDRVVLYINGVDERTVGGYSTSNMPNQGVTGYINYNAFYIGVTNPTANSNHFNGIMSHVHFTDGYAYDASAFGEFDANGVWKIKTSPSVSYGTTGFWILKDGNSVTDQSGNSNNFTVGGGTLTNTEDSPSNVFATMNPLDNNYASSTFSNGNNTIVTNSGNYTYNTATLGASSGKYYWEVKVDNTSTVDVIGITGKLSTASTYFLGTSNDSVGYEDSGVYYTNNSQVSPYGDSYTTNDIIGVAMDLDNNKLYFSKNGVFQNSGVPTSGATGTGAIDITTSSTGFYFPALGDYTSAAISTFSTNFGNGYFGTTAVSSAGTNASGIGIFEYDVPTGYTALSTKGLNL